MAINFRIELGGASTTGLTLNVIEDQVDTIYTIISAEDINNEVVNMWFKNRTEKANVYDTLSVDLSAALTLSIIMQSDSETDVDFYTGIGVNLRDVTVEFIS